MKTGLAVALVCFAAQQPQTPVFRGSTDVVVVDARVTHSSGAPIEGLTASDFVLSVDGKPRPIVSVTFQRLGDRPAAGDDAFSTLASPSPVRADSYVLFLVDPAHMETASSRVTLDQLADYLSTLSPAHAVGLMIVPSRKPQYPFSTQRRPIAASLRKQSGTNRGLRVPAEVKTLAAISAAAIESAIDALQAVEGRRTVVYVGDGVGLERDTVDRLAHRASQANVQVFALGSGSYGFPDEANSASPKGPLPDLVDLDAIDQIADRTGGRFYRRFNSLANVLPRLESELSAQYLLTFNLESRDKDGKPHKIDVKVSQKGADVQFRKEFVR